MHSRMVRLTILAATFAVVLFPVAANIDFQVQEDKQTKCEKQIKKQQQLFSCQRYLLKSTKMSPSPPMLVNEGSTWLEEFPLCCDQLEKISGKCRCEAINRVLGQVKDESEGGTLEGVNIKEMLQTARSLANMCRLEPKYCYVPSDIYESM